MPGTKRELRLPFFVGARAVLDTNVVLALWVFDDTRLRRLRGACEAGALKLLTNRQCLAEFARVLHYPEFALDEQGIAALLTRYRRLTEEVVASGVGREVLPPCTDADDQKFLELAWDGDAHLLVTRDKALLRLARRKLVAERLSITTPERLVVRLAGVATAAGQPLSATGPDSAE